MSDPSATAGPPLVRERLIILSLATAAFAMQLNTTVMGPLEPFLGPRYGWDKDQFGFLISIANLSGAVGALLMGPVVDRVGRRGPLLLGLALFTVASAGHCFTENYNVLLVLRMLAGGAVGVAYSSASAALADLVPYERRGAAMGRFATGMFLAIPVGLPIAVLLANAGMWQWVFALQALVGLLALLAAARTVPRGLGAGEWISPHVVIKHPMVIPALLAVMFYVGSFYTPVQFLPGWLDEGGIMAKENQWALWVGLGLSSAFGSMFLARIGDRIGKKNYVLLVTMMVTLLLLLLTKVDSLLPFVLIGLPLATLSASRTGPLQALMSEIVPPNLRGTMMGLRSAFMQFGMGMFTLVGGATYLNFGFDYLLYLSVGGMLASWLTMRLFMGRVN